MSFFGGFAQGFGQTYFAAKQQEQREKLIKAQTKLFEEQLRAAEKQGVAQDKLAAFMTPSPVSTGGRELSTFSTIDIPTQTEGLNEVAFTPNRGNQSIMEIFANPEAWMAAAQSGQFSGDSLLRMASPTAGREFEFQAIARELGADLSTPEGQKTVMDFMSAGESGVDGLLDRVKLSLANLELQDRINQQTSGRAMNAFQLSATAKNMNEAIDLQEELENSLLATGTTFTEFARDWTARGAAAGKALGYDSTDEERLVFAVDRLDKLYGQILNRRIEAAGQGGQTDAAQARLSKISPSVDKRPEANRLLMADFLDEEVARAMAEGTPMTADEIAAVDEVVTRARSTPIRDPQAIIDVVGTAEDIANYTIEQLQSIQQKIESGAINLRKIPDEARVALERRWDELTNGE